MNSLRSGSACRGCRFGCGRCFGGGRFGRGCRYASSIATLRLFGNGTRHLGRGNLRLRGRSRHRALHRRLRCSGGCRYSLGEFRQRVILGYGCGLIFFFDRVPQFSSAPVPQAIVDWMTAVFCHQLRSAQILHRREIPARKSPPVICSVRAVFP